MFNVRCSMYNAKSLALWALMALFVLISVNVYGQVEGKFSGTIVVAPGQNLEFIANFTTEAGKLKAAIDILSNDVQLVEFKASIKKNKPIFEKYFSVVEMHKTWPKKETQYGDYFFILRNKEINLT